MHDSKITDKVVAMEMPEAGKSAGKLCDAACDAEKHCPHGTPETCLQFTQCPTAEVSESRILLIDDDDVFLHLCKRYLRSDTTMRHKIVSVTTIMEALLAIRHEKFDCIVVDYCLSDGSGTEAIKQLRDIQQQKMPSSIVMTGQSGEQAAIDAMRSGANDFIYKGSLNKSSLCRAVNNAVEKTRLRELHLTRLQELEVANALLRKRNEEIQRFYHTVSHEVKTPLTAIQEFVSIVHDGLAGEVQEEQKAVLKYALQSCDQIKSQFDELLELSRFETGSMQVNLSANNIHEVFDHCMAAATPGAVARNIELRIEDQPDLPKVMMQSSRIVQVLSNLIGNALKFTPEFGSVVVGAHLVNDGKRLRLSVTDTGCGIPAKNIKHVFDRLYQVTPASDRENESGMGLGLSIAAQIVELHGSSINLESTVGEGSEFSFELETCQPEAAAA